MYVFYTYVGDFFADCGFVGCVIVCALLFILGKKIFSYKNYSIYNIFAGSMYCKIFLTGFTYIVYINTLTEFITASIFFTLCKVCQKTYLIKATNHKV